MKVYTILSNDRGHICIVVVLQSCTDPLHILPSSSRESFPTSSDCTHDVGNTKVEEEVEVIEECFVGIKKEAETAIKQEEIPEDVTSPDIRPDHDKVSSYVCMCIFRHILPVCSFFNVNISS
jgi:hypothetical protein